MLTIFLLLTPLSAQAAEAGASSENFFDFSNETRLSICEQYGGYTNRVVGCVSDAIFQATTKLLQPFANVANTIVGVAAALALIFYAFNMLTGRGRQLGANTVALLFKLGLLTFIGLGFSQWYPYTFSIMNELVGMAAEYMHTSQALSCPLALTVWDTLDCTLNNLIGGLLPGVGLGAGLLGFVVGAAFSGPVGFSIFAAGIAFFFFILLAVAKAVYIFLMSFISISVLSLIAPIMFLLLMFRSTKAYFEKWLRMMLGLMLQPIFLFVYLSILLAAFDVMIYSGPRSLYSAVVGQQVAAQPNFRIGDYMQQQNVYVKKTLLKSALTLRPGELAPLLTAQAGAQGVGPLAGVMNKVNQNAAGFNNLADKSNAKLGLDLPAVDFQVLANLLGLTLEQYYMQVMLSLVTALVVAYILHMLLGYIPNIGMMTAGAEMSGGKVIGMPNFAQQFDQMAGGAKKLAGGGAKT